MSDLVTTQEQSVAQLFAGDFPRIAKAVTLLANIGALVLGTVLGKITKGAVSKAAVDGVTGNGTLTLDTIAPKIEGAIAGVYTIRVKRAAIAAPGTTPAVAAQLAICELKDPNGNVLEVFDLPATPGIEITNQVKFVILEGNTPFIVGDGFDITIAAGSGLYRAYDKDNVDGSEVADCILAEAITVGAANAPAIAYKTGHFNSAALTGYDTDALADFESKGNIFIGTVV